MIRGLDHVVLVVVDLAAAVAEHQERGFTVTLGGEHASGLSHNALVGFQDNSYLELIAFHDLAAAHGKHRWAPVAERGGGWADFALLSSDLGQDTAALGDLVARAPDDGGRLRPDGVALAWRAARLEKPLPFLIEDVTARDLRVPSGAAAKHANGLTRVEAIVLGATDAARLIERYAKLRERGAPDIEVRRADRDGLIDVRFR
jgi:hypothetical protein